MDLIDAVAGEIRLRCTLAEFARLGWAKETHFLPKSGVYPGYAPGQVFSWPYYGVGGRLTAVHMGNLPQTVTYHSVPLGEVEISRGEPVHATDGDIGEVQGLVIDPRNHHVTHVLLRKGHLPGRQEIAIPISAVASTGNGIRLKITKQEVRICRRWTSITPTRAPAGGEDMDDRSGHRLRSRVRRARCASSRAPGCGCPRALTQVTGSGCTRRKTGRGSPPAGRGAARGVPAAAGSAGHLGVLVVLQAIDAATTTCGGTPAACPARGETGIFNRSHYKEVLIPGSPARPARRPQVAHPDLRRRGHRRTLIEIGPRHPVMDEAARRELLLAKAELEAEAPPGAAEDPAAANLGT